MILVQGLKGAAFKALLPGLFMGKIQTRLMYLEYLLL